jgi:hypothetical protein
MAICITDPIEKQRYEQLVSVVGKKEAARDYFEQNEMVRPPSVVIKKIKDRAMTRSKEVIPSMEDFMDGAPISNEFDIESMPAEIEAMIARRNASISQQAIDDISKRLGIPYKFISEADAHKKTASNVKGFYSQGEVFLVEGKFTPETVFHEFMHPVIKSMSVDNPELFNKLFQDVIATDFGKTIEASVKEDPYYSKQNNARMKEETIVRALTHMNENSEDNRTLLDKFLYHIRQFLRKMLGRKVNVGKLSLNTSLEDMIQMMNMSENFKLNEDFLKADEVVMLQKEYKVEIDNLEKRALSDVQKMQNEFRDILKKQVGLMQEDRGIFSNLSDDLVNKSNSGILQEMLRHANEISSSLNSTKGTLTKPLSDININDAEDIASYARRMDSFMENIAKSNQVLLVYNKLIDTIPSIEAMEPHQMNQIQAISILADKWSLYFKQQKNNLVTESFRRVFPKDGVMQGLIAELEVTAEEVKMKADKLRFDAVADMTYRLAKKEYETAERFYTEKLDSLERRGLLREYHNVYYEYHGITVAEQNEIDDLEDKLADNTRDFQAEDENRLDKLRFKKVSGHEVSRDGIRDMLDSKGPDASIINAYLEGFMESQDKIVGTFFSFMYDNLSEVNANSNTAQAAFLKGLKPLLQKARINQAEVFGVNVPIPGSISLDDARKFGEGGIGRVLGREVEVGKLESETTKDAKDSLKPETKTEDTVIDWKQWQFLSNFKGEDRALLELNTAITTAQRRWNYNQTDANETAYNEAVAEKEQFLIDYMHQDKVPEYYEAQSLFKDDIGVKAKAEITKFYEELNQMEDIVNNNTIDINAMEATKKKWREYTFLHSITDEKGKKKTGEDLEIAERLIKYREATRDFYKHTLDSEKFQLAYDAFLDFLEMDNVKAGTPAHKAKLDEWLEHNTVVEITEDYYAMRSEALDEKSRLLKPLIDINANIKDTAPMYKEIYRISALAERDSQGHYIGTTLSPENQALIKEQHEKIEEARYGLYTSLGLTRAELDDYTSMRTFKDSFDRYEDDSHASKVEAYEKRIGQGLSAAPFNIGKQDIARILELDAILSSVTRTNATRDYINKMEGLLNDESSEESFYGFLDKIGVDTEDEVVLSEKNLEVLLSPLYSEKLEVMLEQNDKFRVWFHNNHYKGDRMVTDKAGEKSIQEVYIKTALWNYSAPKSTDFYKGFPLKNEAGNVTGVLKYNNQPRVPNSQYSTREVKDEYLTPRIERDYVNKDGQLILANIDAQSGKWLPRTMEQGAKDTRFIEPAYMDMFNNDRPLWDVLQHTKENHLDNQKTMERGQRLGLAYPRNRKGDTENYSRGFFYRSGEKNWRQGILKGRLLDSLARMWQRRDDDVEIGMSSKKDSDRYESLSRPVSGTYDINSNEVSTNIFGSMHDYAHSVEMFKSLRKINSYAQSVNDMLQESATDKEVRWVKRAMRGLTLFSGKAPVRARAWAVGNIIDHWFQGQELSGRHFFAKKLITQSLNHLMRKNSQKWFKYNEIASITNAAQGKIQMVQKSWDRRLPNMKNLAIGEYKSTKAMAQFMRYSYSSKEKPAQLQLLTLMDALPDNARKNLGDTAARNIHQDIISGQIGYISRHNMQNQVEVQAFYGMMDKAKYRFQIAGKGSKVSIDEAIELVKGRVQTKEGVPEEFSIRYNEEGEAVLGSKIKEVIRMHHGYLQKIIGMAGKKSEGEFLSRHLLGKYVFSLFKFFPAMVMDRYKVRGSLGDILKGRGRRRFNHYMKDVEYGRVIGAFDMIRQGLNTGFKGVNGAEVKDALQVITFFIMRSALLYFMSNLAFNVGQGADDDEDYAGFSGFDPEEQGMIKNLEKTTSLPEMFGLITHDRTRSDVDWNDYIKLQSLRLAIRFNRENNTIMPVDWNTGGGMVPIGVGMLSLRSPIQGGILEDYSKFGTLLYEQLLGDKMEQKSETGPYIWQQEGSNKWLKWYTNYRGFTGSIPDPVRGIKGESLNK